MDISFKDFMVSLIEESQFGIVEESIEARINELADGGIFTNLGEEYIRNKFSEYQDQNVVPKNIANLSKKSEGGTNPITDKQLEEVLSYVFKFVDKDVQMDLLKLESSNDPKIRKKIEKHYQGLNTIPAVEDGSTIRAILGNYIAARTKPKYKLPKSLREKTDFRVLGDKANAAVEEILASNQFAANQKGDTFIPNGMTLVEKSGDYELIQWHTDDPEDSVCSLPEDKFEKFSSQRRDLSGELEQDWCVFYDSADNRDSYGEKGSDNKFKYPYYLIRKGGRPYALLHGHSLQAKQAKSQEPPITQEHADELWEALLSKPAESGKNWLEEILKDHV